VSRPLAVVALALGLAAAPPAAGGASLSLGEGERAAALREGQRSVTSDAFGREWRIANGTGESVTVLTPFHRLALIARDAAFKNEPVKPRVQDRVLAELRERLVFWADLVGPREDFARHLRPSLLVGSRELEPTLAQNERTAVPTDEGRYLARCVYWFPSHELTGRERVTLLVRAGDGQPLTRFTIDLGRMR
jgi:hypothetical protein